MTNSEQAKSFEPIRKPRFIWYVLGFGLLIVSVCTIAYAGTSDIPSPERFVLRAAFSMGRLWILDDTGDVFSITQGDSSPVNQSPRAPALDLCERDRKAFVVTCARGGCSDWSLLNWSGTDWTLVNRIPTLGDGFLAMSCDERQVTILTTRRVIGVKDGQLQVTVLQRELSPQKAWSSLVSMVILDEPTRVPLGRDKGEWGGGLWSIDKSSGSMNEIARNDSGSLCGGPLNTGCDPVNALAPIPWRPGCVAVAVGLVHMTSHGRIVAVCGSAVSRLYFKPVDKPQVPNAEAEGDEPFETAAFFGIASRDGRLWASSTEGIYRIDQNSVKKVGALPNFTKVGDFYVSFGLPDLVLVETNINARSSVSGFVPMIVAR